MRGLVLILVMAASSVATAAPNNKVEEARAAILTDQYQPELPDSDGNGSGTVHHEKFQRGDQRIVVDTRDETETGRMDRGPGSSLFTFIVWAAVIVGALVLVIWLATELGKYGGADAEIADNAIAPAGPDLAVIARPLDDAEELARRGLYRDAIHTLLLRTLQELVRSSAIQVRPAMTSREILGRVPLLADARDALAGLITAVELTHFGGDDATADDYARCRTQFHRFAEAFRASGVRADAQGSGTVLA